MSLTIPSDYTPEYANYIFCTALCETCSSHDFCDRMHCQMHTISETAFKEVKKKIKNNPEYEWTTDEILKYISYKVCDDCDYEDSWCDYSKDTCSIYSRFFNAANYIRTTYPPDCLSKCYEVLKNGKEQVIDTMSNEYESASYYSLFNFTWPDEDTKTPTTSKDEHIKDSGDRTEFDSGAVRDMRVGKGRCDLLPLDVVSMWIDINETREEMDVLDYINHYIWEEDHDSLWLFAALNKFAWYETDYMDRDEYAYKTPNEAKCYNKMTAILEVAVHFEQGAAKYDENNWRKGIPVKCFLDSAIRHYIKYSRGDKDERHDRAFIWNILCAIWTMWHKPELGYDNFWDFKKEN